MTIQCKACAGTKLAPGCRIGPDSHQNPPEKQPCLVGLDRPGRGVVGTTVAFAGAVQVFLVAVLSYFRACLRRNLSPTDLHPEHGNWKRASHWLADEPCPNLYRKRAPLTGPDMLFVHLYCRSPPMCLTRHQQQSQGHAKIWHSSMHQLPIIQPSLLSTASHLLGMSCNMLEQKGLLWL